MGVIQAQKGGPKEQLQFQQISTQIPEHPFNLDHESFQLMSALL